MSKNVFVNVCISLVTIALLQVCFPTRALAQQDEVMGKITLNPYLPESEDIGAKATKGLISKLGQIATAAGMSGKGFDDRAKRHAYDWFRQCRVCRAALVEQRVDGYGSQ